MQIESNNEILSFTDYLLANGYTVNAASNEPKRRYLVARKAEKSYMIELGALGSDEEGYGIYRIQDEQVRNRLSPVVPIKEFDADKGIAVQ